jgi:hypothetical protein
MNCSMARRVLILLWGAGAGLYPLCSYALGLGELQVESRLNQPLRARIEVSDVSDDEWHRLRAHLSWQQSTADGLSRPGLLESVTFKNVEAENHRRFIEVRSAEIFTEPLFDLSIDVSGIDADVTRIYTVFLDPPGSNDDLRGARGPMLASQPAAAPASVRHEPAMVAHPAHRKTPAASTAADNASTASYTVSKSDTLGKIARRFGGATAASRNRFMDWVFQHNSAAFYGDMNRLRAGARLALPESTAAAGAQVAASAAQATGADPAGKAQLQGELAGLEQELTGLQKMIAQQDAQIASLKQQIAARDEQQRSTPASHASTTEDQAAAAAAAAAKSTAALAHADQAGDSPYQDEAARAIDYSNEPQSQAASASAQSQPQAPEPQSQTAALSSAQVSDNTGASQGSMGLWARSHVRNSVYYWVAGIVVLTGLVVRLLFYIRRRMEESTPDVQLRYPIGPTFERDTEAREARASLLETLPMTRPSGSGSAAAKLSAALKRREPDGISGAMPESEHEEAVDDTQDGLDTWRTQTALLEQDILSETDLLPFVLDTQNQMKAVDEDMLSPSELTHKSREIVSDIDLARDLREEDFADTATSIPTEQLPGMVAEDIAEPAAQDAGANDATVKVASQPDEVDDDSLLENVGELPAERSATHQDIVKALESSLDYQPDRVDIQLKLLEIYHHEALGNRENFQTMLRKLSDRHNLSPAQRLHVEMLQRTLHDGDSSFVAEEEM